VGAARRAGLGEAERLRVGFVGAAANELTREILRAFGDQHRGTEVVLRRYDISDPSAGLNAGHSDVAFVRDFVDQTDITTSELLREPRVYVLPADHPLAERHSLGPEDVAEEPGIGFASAIAEHQRHQWKEHRGEDRPVEAVAGSIEEWLTLIESGRGITTAPASTARFFARPGLAFVPARGAEPSVVSIAWRTDGRSGTIDRFVAIARHVAARS
jgi:DNA-binding transcriptional LysR family regulator